MNIQLNHTEMLNCQKCLYNSSHPFGLGFKNGVCTGCITHEEKNFLNWDIRLEILIDELKKFKTNARAYDCVVPVIGDAEDFYTLSKVLQLGLSPLVVSVNDYFKNDIGWHNLHQLITYFDVDSLIYNPEIHVYKELIRTSLRKYNHILLPFLQLHTSFPVHIAYERKIPLVVWGQNQAIEQVGKFSHTENVKMSGWNRKEHDLFNIDTSLLIGNGAQVKIRDLNYYNYPNIEKLSKRGVTGIYLSNYFRWDPLFQNNSTLKYGFKPERNSYSFDIYERAGSSVYYKIHDLLKYKRVGYRKITDHLVREIRHKRISIKEAKVLNEEYLKKPVNIKPFFEWLDVTKTGYEWLIKHKFNDIKNLLIDRDTPTKDNHKIPNNIKSLLKHSSKSKKQFILFGKGIDI